jgi:DNA-binding CsgD family transcriptional regulator
MKNTKLYHVWQSMKDRCNNPNSKSFKDYGQKGIMVCGEWLDDFINFYNWSVSNGYSEGLSIDRINNEGNYDPYNCRWATSIVQNNNKSSNRHIFYNGEIHSIAEWERLLGFKKNTLYARLITCEMPINEAFSYKRKYESRDRLRLNDIDITALKDRELKVIKMRNDGVSFAKIGAALGFSKTTAMSIVYGLLKKEGKTEE